MPTKMSGKWAIGPAMTQWCERNGLDARQVIDREDAIEIIRDPDRPGLEAEVLHMLPHGEAVGDLPYDDITSTRWGEYVMFTRRVPVDSYPPLNDEWVALFGKPEGWA
ncbi:MAG: hypothetical protein Q4F67_16850 [Propionibacteriaceae bacterium]|nr:hypothetical protein [Propionibacteriaceae bacterium]